MVAYGRYLPNIKETFQVALTFFLAVIGWIIFRAETMTQAIEYLSAMVTNKFFDATMMYGLEYLYITFPLLIIEWLQRNKQHALQFPNNQLFSYRIVRWGVYYFILFIIGKYAGSSQTFVYFQF